ncbi:type II/IV secretion system ATPase subunit [uncultured Methanomethylovorans sp.]|uniref:type II/IV secretion system ATPase subunit n=1 Tax=uncultured Methanomethylovorans sp. TaxID=183759 RepID=UPI002AA687E6|nr:type II/IV secretion system ATPase subunit [uncultured Methanomethylovorans sp.]
MDLADEIQHSGNASEVPPPALQGTNNDNKNSGSEEAIDLLLSDISNDNSSYGTADDLKSRLADDHIKLISNHNIDFDGNTGWEQKVRNIIDSKELAIEYGAKVEEEKQVPLHQRLIDLISNKEEFEEDYNIAIHGPIVEFATPEGSNFKEIEMYAVNPPYAYIRVAYNPITHEYQYQVLEPLLSEEENKLLGNMKQQLIETLELNLKETDHKGAEKYLREYSIKYLKEYKIDISVRKRERVMYHLIRDFLGFGRIDPLMRDMRLEDVSCDGPNTPIYVFHKSYNSVPTNVIFSDDDELDAFAIRIAQLCGRHISIANPLLDATMPDGSRIQLTLGREVTTRGSTFTIRRFNENPITPANLVNYHTFSTAMMAYLWMAVDSSKSIVFVGGTASGKTTAMNAVSLFIQPEMKIVSIEDTRELNLSHPNWIPGVTRESFAGEERGSIQMYELLRAALRQRPEYILVGEVRGAEAYVLFQAMSTGHTTFSTMHADSVQSVVHRLENPPINVPRIMIQALDIVSIQAQVKVNDERVRRCKSLTEIVGVDPRTGELLTNEVFIWDAAKDAFQYSGRSYILESIMENRGWTEDKLKDELKKRQDILEWTRVKKISHYKDFAKLVVTYGREPETIMKQVRQDMND